jgi:hypothetical protein
MKTPEEMAEEYARENWGSGWEHDASIDAFLAGYKAAKDRQEYLMNEMSILRSRLDTAEKLSQLVDEEKEQ